MPYIGILESEPVAIAPRPVGLVRFDFLVPIGHRRVGLLLALLQRRPSGGDHDVSPRERAVGIGDDTLQQQRAVVPRDFRQDPAVDVGAADLEHVLALHDLVGGDDEQSGQRQRQGNHVATSYYAEGLYSAA